MAIIKISDLEKIRKKHLNQRIVFCSGSFDLIHAGHVIFFEDCKTYGDILVVMIASDKVIKKSKGAERPIMNQHIRIKLIDSLKPVDYCFIDNIASKNIYSLKYLDTIFKKLKPDIYVINEDAFDIPFRKNLVKNHKIELKILKRKSPKKFEKISTSKLIEKMKGLNS